MIGEGYSSMSGNSHYNYITIRELIFIHAYVTGEEIPSSQPLQNTNYKDWFNICQDNQRYGNNAGSFASSETINGVGAGMIVAGTMLGAFAAPVTAAIIISFGTLLPILWKSDEEAKTIWQEFVKIGNRPFNSVADQAIINLLYDSIKGLQGALNEYNREFNSWKASRTPATATAVLNTFHNTHVTLITNLQGTLSGQYKIQMLPGYAQVANWHLNLLQQASLYYDEWVKDSRKPAEIYFEEYVTPSNEIQTCLNTCSLSNGTAKSAYYKCSLKCYIKEYTNYCTKTYNDGLNMLKTQSGVSWNIYNTYRREITLTVLDLIALFPNYDSDYYPIGVKSELTREVYTNANSDTFRTIIELENGLTRNPTLFTWINQGRFYTRNSQDILDPHGNFSFTGNQMAFTHTNDDRNIIWGSVHGNVISQDTSKIFPFYRNAPIDKVEIVRHRDYSDIIYEMIFFSNNREVFRYSSNSTIESNYKRTDSYMIPTQTWENKEYGHTLSYIKTDNYIFSVVRERRRVAFGWTYNSVDFQNTINLDNITQIHAVKALKLSQDSKIVEGPGHTGGDLVILKDSMDIRVRFLKNVSRQYQVRIRYATDAPKTTVFLTGIDTISVELPSTTSRKNPNATDLTYADFGYATFTRTVPNKTFEGEDTLLMTLYGIPNHSYNIYIDKIEFIPITQSVLDYTEKQNLEKTQKTVNDLFIN